MRPVNAGLFVLLAALVAGTLSAAVPSAHAQNWGPPPPPPSGFNPSFQYRQYGMQPPPAPMGQRCASVAGVCFMGGTGPAGSPCFCQTPYGPAQGQVVP